MNNLAKAAFASLVASGLGAMSAAPASAGMILGYEEIGPSGPVTGSGMTNTIPVPGSSFYGNTFTAPTTPIAGSSSPGYGFYDDFLINIPAGGASADSITSTISYYSLLDINDLEVRLYNEAGNTPLPVLGAPNGGAISAWSTTMSDGPGETGTMDVLSATLGPGTYVLEVRGNVTGESGGSYSGSLNLVPMPLPAALPLMLSGLGVLCGVLRRRRAD